MVIDSSSRKFVIENSIDSIKATIHSQKKWGWFVPSFFILVMNGLCFLPILGFLMIGIFQKYLTGIFLGMMLTFFLALYLLIVYKKSRETFDYLFDREIIEINGQHVIIDRSGFLGLRIKKVFSADKIKGITTSPSLSGQFNYLNFLLFTSSNFGAFMIWRVSGLRQFYNFGKGVSQSDAQYFINTVYSRFPKYQYSYAK